MGLQFLKVYISKFLRFAKMQVHSVKGYNKGTGNINPFPNKSRLFETESLFGKWSIKTEEKLMRKLHSLPFLFD